MVDIKKNGIEDLFQFGSDIIRNSGELALSYYGKGKSQMKFDEELVTGADLRLMEYFQEQLHSRFPEHQVFTNNQENTDYTHDDERYLWIYDTLDGIANLQAGIPIWGLSLALVENFWPLFGMFYMPVTDDLFHARVGQTAYRGDEEIRVSTQNSIDDESLLLTYSRFHHHYASTFPGKIRNLGCTTAHVCYVAMGRAEAALIANESYQGLATARVIIEAAGGKIYKMDGSEFSLDEYLDGQRIDDHLLVVSPHLHAQVRDSLKEKS